MDEFEFNQYEREVLIDQDNIELGGILAMPPGAQGLVIFAHGSGSGRLSPRNNFVARVLQQDNLATLLLDLLMDEEAIDRRNVFDIQLLSDRLLLAKQWFEKLIDVQNVKNAPNIQNVHIVKDVHKIQNGQKDKLKNKLKIGYFGASTGAAAAIVAAAKDPSNIHALVSRGGRPDLGGEYLSKIQAPTLLLVGGNDDIVIDLNQEAYARLNCVKELQIIPGATHLFEEPGTLEEVARLAAEWFSRHLK